MHYIYISWSHVNIGSWHSSLLVDALQIRKYWNGGCWSLIFHQLPWCALKPTLGFAMANNGTSPQHHFGGTHDFVTHNTSSFEPSSSADAMNVDTMSTLALYLCSDFMNSSPSSRSMICQNFGSSRVNTLLNLFDGKNSLSILIIQIFMAKNFGQFLISIPIHLPH